MATGEVLCPNIAFNPTGLILYKRKHGHYFPFQAAYIPPKHERTWVGKGLKERENTARQLLLARAAVQGRV